MVPDTKDVPVPSYSHCFAAQLKAAASNPPRISYHWDISFPSVSKFDVEESCSSEDAGLTLPAVLDAQAGLRAATICHIEYLLCRARPLGRNNFLRC